MYGTFTCMGTIGLGTSTCVTAWCIGTKGIDIAIVFKLAFVNIFALIPFHIITRVTNAFIRTISVVTCRVI